MKRIYISSSITNFKDKLRKRYEDYGDFKWFSKDPTIFFGCYHIGDYLRIIFHRGEGVVFFCGSDILQLPKWMVPFLRKYRNYCENSVEATKLHALGLGTEIHPMLFDDHNKYQITYEHSSEPTVWMSYHLGREEEYGLYRFIGIAREIPNLRFRFFNGQTPIDDFDEVTSKYQATIRFNEFDGFSENLAKAMLRGQYAWSVIPYPDVETITDDATLIRQLKELANKHQPHDTSYWREQLSKRVEI